MSGPKYSDIILERERQEMLRLQLEAEIEAAKCRELKTEIKSLTDQTSTQINRVDIEKLEENIIKASEELDDKELISVLKQQLQSLKELSDSTPQISGDSSRLQNILKQYEERDQKIREVTRSIQELSFELKSVYTEVHQSNKESDFENRSWVNKQFHVNMTQELADAYQAIMSYIDGRADQEKIQHLINGILANHEVDDSYKASQLEMRLQALQIEDNSKERDELRKAELTVEYNALCELYYGEKKEVPIDSDAIALEISHLKEILEDKKSSQYISQAVKSVMSEMGYTISSEEILTEQKMEKQFYDYSPNSMVSIATSSNGAVMLEVVGKNKSNGANSKTAVRMDMERFCPDYERIKEGLKAYGIIMTDKKLFPPDEKYVRFMDSNTDHNRRVSVKKKSMRMGDE